MSGDRRITVLDAASLVLVLGLALALRLDWSYRTAFADEAYTLHSGWQLLRGETTYAASVYMGWEYLTTVPLSLADSIGGLAAARALNTLWGVLTVLVVTLLGRKLFGRAAGIMAGATLAVFSPAIFINTFATYDSLSVFLLSLALYSWLVAAMDDRSWLYPLGSLAMTLAVLAKYAAVSAAWVATAFVVVVLLVRAVKVARSESAGVTISLTGRPFRQLVLLLLPFCLFPVYAAVFQNELFRLWQMQIVTKQSAAPNVAWEMFKQWRDYLGLPFLAGLLAFDWRGRRWPAAGLLMAGLGVVGYHWLNQDVSTLYKHTVYVLVALAPLVGGGVVSITRGWSTPSARRTAVGVALAAGAAIVLYVGYQGQQVLGGMRSFWPDATAVVAYLRDHVRDGDVLLMEHGAVGRYYLIVHGESGRIPGYVWDTWWYADEEGDGGDAATFERAVRQRRFAFIVFDYVVTADLDRQLMPAIEQHYDHAASFPSSLGAEGRIDVFRRSDR